MSATKLHEAGYTDLVSVIPPGAKVSPNSKIQPDQLGKIPGKKGKQGWFGYAFTKEDPVDPQKIERWGASVGLLGNRFPALDIDSNSQKLTDAVLRAAAQYLGRAPVRLSREPRRLLVYRTDHPFGRMALVVNHKGKRHLIEFLGKGRQYLVHGRHPSGVDYRWCNEKNGWEPEHMIGDLWEIFPEEIPRIDADMAQNFLVKLKEFFDEKGVECEIVGDGKDAAEKAPPQDDLLAPSLEALAEVVEKIPNDQDSSPDREHYLQVGYAIKAAGGEEAFEVFAEWAGKRVPDDRVEGNPETWASDWERMQPPFRVGWTWLQEQAERYSDYASATDEFEADMSMAQAEPEPEPEADDDEQPDVNVRIGRLTDEGIAEVTEREIGDRVRYVSVNNEWHIWNGYAWAVDNRNEIFALTRGVLRRIRDALLERAEAANNQRAAKQLRDAASRVQTRSVLENTVKLLSYSRALNAVPDEFDHDPWILNTPGKLIILHDEGIEVRDNDARFMCAKSTAISPERGEPKLWLRFLEETTEGDEELIEYLQKFCGYCLSGVVVEQFLPFVWGRSQTGKSVFLKTISGVLGTYWKPASLEMFQSSRDTRHPAELAELDGARLVTATETQEGRVWDEQRIKAITSGDPMQVHKKYGHPFTLHPTFKIVVAGNHEPTIKNLDDAMKRRLHVVPFDRVVPSEDRDEALVEKLTAEWGQILRWMLEGYVMWRVNKLSPPAAVLARTKTYFSEEDLIGQWLEECCELGDEFEASRNALYASWEEWCNRHGYEPGGFKTFRRKLRPFGFDETQVGEARLKGNRGLRIKPALEEGIHGDFD